MLRLDAYKEATVSIGPLKHLCGRTYQRVVHADCLSASCVLWLEWQYLQRQSSLQSHPAAVLPLLYTAQSMHAVHMSCTDLYAFDVRESRVTTLRH